MAAIYPILSLLLTFALALLIIRIGSIALRMTGVSPDIASFQAASAFSGAGFTTEESEVITATPGRRHIAKQLIRFGSLGLVSAIASLVLSFTNASGGNLTGLIYIISGAVLLILLARSQWLNHLVTPLIERALSRTTDLELRDYTQVLGLQDDYRVAELDTETDEWLTSGTLAELDLPAEGVRVLAIDRADGSYIGAPGPDTEIRPGDTVVLYGQEHRLQELSERDADDTQAHEAGIEDHEQQLEVQEQDTESEA
ncbi:TrkA-C domain protein [Haladaptatus sp. R4]|uniref:TrkA C-terminal domain-containing protein n=1 Tax=Haladaptatus sp. R4 TaxID=1679489 RepID=UPI0007B47496|nr:TrkA C-terminal domain-containing protein [Haladaptatus sp. R4]KZN23035.1 TrkA-C domain protein [Haladaptatus sp. R4]